MIDFEQFVKSLGPHAAKYTTAQLQQIHADVRKLAQVLLAIHQARLNEPNKTRSFPQKRLDADHSDRTMKADK